MSELTDKELQAVADAAEDALERCWNDWLQTGEAKEMGVSQKKADLAHSAVLKIRGLK